MTDNPFDRSEPVVPRVQDTGLRSLDLTGRERNLRQAIATLGRVAAAFARSARRTLPFLVWRKSRLLPQSVAISSVPGETQEDERIALHALLQEEGGQAWALVSLNDISLGLILEGSLGALESKGNFSFGRELTLAQRALSGRLLRALAEDLRAALRAETELDAMTCVVFSTPRDSEDHGPGQDGLSVDCLVEGVPGAIITIAVQAAALEGASRDNEADEEPQGDPRMNQIVQDVPVEVIAELGRLTMGLRSVLNLEVGQVLRLSTAVDDAVRVDVGGLKKFTGVPVVSRGQLAVEIRARLGD
jgi:flagellar motor switch/type III secretory pathway protein FliN